MARMNISVPDPLYERLDRLRDRVNASKVCAQALEKELDMLEGRSLATADPDIGRLLERLQGARDRWYDRGRQDGKRWAVSDATRDELWKVADEYTSEDGEELAEMVLHHRHGPEPWWPATVDVRAQLREWLRRDAESSGTVLPAEEVATDRGEKEEDDDAWRRARGATRAGRATQAESAVDEAAYMEGWRDVVVDVWNAIAPSLRSRPSRRHRHDD